MHKTLKYKNLEDTAFTCMYVYIQIPFFQQSFFVKTCNQNSSLLYPCHKTDQY